MRDGAPRLVSDIGGTNARFALVPSGSVKPVQEKNLRCADFPGPVEATRHYLSLVGRPPVREAAIDVATGITGDYVQLTNGPWAFSIEQTRRSLGLDRLHVINDFTALALGVPLLGPDEKRQVGPGEPVPETAIGVIGAGTGLGVSGLLPFRGRWIAVQGEGGHTSFSPMTTHEDAVLQAARMRYGGHVSTERLVSGPGLKTLYETVCQLEGQAPVALEPAQVTERALAGSDRQCSEALELFCAMLGTAAANLAAILGARGGVYIGGGIVPKLGDYLERSGFRRRFEDKGRFRAYVSAIPTYVILAETPALRGLASLFDTTE